MSLIRCLSNPEGLYVWGDRKNVHFMIEGLDVLVIPHSKFNGIMKKYRGVNMDMKYGKDTSLQEIKCSDSSYRLRLKYKNKSVSMWEVTFRYIHKNWLQQQQLCPMK